MDELENELVQLSAVTRSTEDWSKEYSRSPEHHAALLKAEGKLLVILARYYRDMAQNAKKFVNWEVYRQRRKLDYTVDVVVNDSALGAWDDTFMRLTFNTVSTLITTGALAGEAIYKVPIGIQSTDAILQKLTTEEVAKLVGKRVLEDGSIIDNPNAQFNVNETVRKDIVQSIKSSLGLGETTEQTVARIQKVIANPYRAQRIANTESVNAYQEGLFSFAKQSGAVGKEWQTAGARDRCLDYEHEGIVPLNYEYGNGSLKPTAHVNCKCSLRLVYQTEWDQHRQRFVAS